MEAADPRLTQEEAEQVYRDQVAKELQELTVYAEAVTNEFANVKNEDEDVIAEKAKARVIELVPDAAIQIKHLITHAESEATRKDLSKWVFGIALKAADENKDEDEMTRLVRVLTN